MDTQQIEAEIGKLEAEVAAIQLQASALSLVGFVGGIYLASKSNKGLLGKIGYGFTGSMLARLPIVFINSQKLAGNLARIEQLKKQLPQKPSLFEELSNQYN